MVLATEKVLLSFTKIKNVGGEGYGVEGQMNSVPGVIMLSYLWRPHGGVRGIGTAPLEPKGDSCLCRPGATGLMVVVETTGVF